jgi:hypothetical protein
MKVLELQRVLDEEDRRVVADHVVVALGRVELQREPARVAPGVGAAALAGDGRETREHVGPDAGLEERGMRVGADVVGRLEVAEGARALGMGLALGDPLPIEVGHLLDQVLVLQQDRTVRSDGQRVLVAGDRDAGVSGGGRYVGHFEKAPLVALKLTGRTRSGSFLSGLPNTSTYPRFFSRNRPLRTNYASVRPPG